MATPDLIFCAGGNKRFAEIAVNAGFLYGARLPSTVYYPLYFADQNWKKPDREAYVNAVAKHRPYMASVMDWERLGQLSEVLGWAEDIAPHVQVVMIIPKVQSSIHMIPKTIGGKAIRLGYSIPTKHGGTGLPYSDFVGWGVHLLGGSPHKQMRLARYMDVKSADGNMSMKMAKRGSFWQETPGTKGHFVNLREVGIYVETDAPYKAFELSCKNILDTWKTL